MDLNKVMLIGRLARDPELKSLASGRAVCSFAVATNRQWVDKGGEKQKDAQFHRVVAWGKLAELVGQYLHKGKQVFVEGRLQTRDWVGQDNVKRVSTEVVAGNVILLSSGRTASGGEAAVKNTEENNGNNSINLSDDSGEVIEEEIQVETVPF